MIYLIILKLEAILKICAIVERGIRNEILNHLDHTLLNKQLIEEILEDKYKFEMFSSKYFKSKEKLKVRSKNALEFFLDQDNEVIDFLR